MKNENPNINDETFFKNIYIKSQNKPIVIFNGLRNIPAQKFFERKSFLSEQNEIILINNDDELDALIRRREKTENIHIKAKGQKIYHIIRNGSEIIVDSLTKNIYDFRKPIKINFKKTEIKDRIVYGIVKDSIGDIIIGSNIIVEGTTRGTSTDFDGSYSIQAKKNEYIVFSFIGKKSQRIIADKTEINVELKSDGIILKEVLPYEPRKPRKKENWVTLPIKLKDLKYAGTPKYDFQKATKNNIFIIFVSKLTIYDFNKEDLEFQKKYNVKYSLIGNHKIDYLTKYNKLSFKHLKKKFKKAWLTEIRKDAVGLDTFLN
jgi:CarboxypepD_reg-like domain